MPKFGLAFGTYGEPALLKYPQHGQILCEDLCNKPFDACGSRDSDEVAHQRPTDAASLIVVDDRKSNFGLSGLHDDVTSAADYRCSIAFFDHRYQCYMIDEIHVQKEVRFPIREVVFWNEETATE
jgi:hypothetical protein